MLSGQQYRESLRDGRVVYLDGRRVGDVTSLPEFEGAVEWVAGVYDRFHSDVDGAFHPMYEIPSSVSELRRRVEVLLDCDMTASLSAVVLALASCRARLSAADPVYGERIDVYIEQCRRNDWRVAEAISDSKGDRMPRRASRSTPTPTCESSTVAPMASLCGAARCTSQRPRWYMRSWCYRPSG